MKGDSKGKKTEKTDEGAGKLCEKQTRASTFLCIRRKEKQNKIK